MRVRPNTLLFFGIALLRCAVPPAARAQPTTTVPPACCPAVRVVATGAAGTLKLGTLTPFPIPAGSITTIDAGPPDTACSHPAIVPTGGFTVPNFCIPALSFTAALRPTGCDGGAPAGTGTMWDGHASCPDADVNTTGDTLDGTCDIHPLPCHPGGPGNTAGATTVERGDGTCDTAALQTQLDIPVRLTVWMDADGDCPDADGVYDPGSDTLVTDVPFILRPTTATATAAFVDQNGDACTREGIGPSGPLTLTGAAAPGPCCTVGQPMTLVATTVAFTGLAPLYDAIAQLTLPGTVTTCGAWPGAATCTIDTTCPPPVTTSTTTTTATTSTTKWTGPISDDPHDRAGGDIHPADTVDRNQTIEIPRYVEWPPFKLPIPPFFRGLALLLLGLGVPSMLFAGGRPAIARGAGIVMIVAGISLLLVF
ncbi:MAG TPA: hypothetical protein VKA21_04850 [Candidatus Binatia bacterium]|nr:hypothetical protein [Candidatus Binatia bacterium]